MKKDVKSFENEENWSQTVEGIKIIFNV